jgi:hypothetical protein
MKEENKKLLNKCFNKVFDAIDNEPVPPSGSLIIFNEGNSCIVIDDGCSGSLIIFNEGNSCIVIDDGCYVIKNYNGKEWGTSAWIFTEALENLKCLPANPRDAQKALIKHGKI